MTRSSAPLVFPFTVNDVTFPDTFPANRKRRANAPSTRSPPDGVIDTNGDSATAFAFA